MKKIMIGIMIGFIMHLIVSEVYIFDFNYASDRVVSRGLSPVKDDWKATHNEMYLYPLWKVLLYEPQIYRKLNKNDESLYHL